MIYTVDNGELTVLIIAAGNRGEIYNKILTLDRYTDLRFNIPSLTVDGKNNRHIP